jgi:hypothetical protein
MRPDPIQPELVAIAAELAAATSSARVALARVRQDHNEAGCFVSALPATVWPGCARPLAASWSGAAGCY